MKHWREAVREYEVEEKNSGNLEEASVLVPVYEGDEGPGMLFTKRSEDMSSHPGQVSFPGGRQEREDESLLGTALRELHEEVGLPSDSVDVVGRLNDARTTTGYQIKPYVGEVPRDYPYVPEESEVDEIIFASLDDLTDPAIHEKKTKKGYELHYFHHGDHTIWGATAQILVTFLEAMGKWPLNEG